MRENIIYMKNEEWTLFIMIDSEVLVFYKQDNKFTKFLWCKGKMYIINQNTLDSKIISLALQEYINKNRRDVALNYKN